MKKYFITLLSILLLTGCGKAEKTVTTKASTEAITEAITEEVIESNLPKEIDPYVDEWHETDLDDLYIIDIKINNAGHMADVADVATQRAAQVNYPDLDILISYTDSDGWVCSWHSYDGKTGILINTLTGYTEENVTVDRLYEWNNK